jgi:YgiT-type zinc finger domain-containing protein
MRPCRLPGCPGTLELKPLLHVVHPKGQVLLFRNVPVWKCDICGDTLFDLETSRRLEQLMDAPGQLVGMVPLYEFVPAPQEADRAACEV